MSQWINNISNAQINSRNTHVGVATYFIIIPLVTVIIFEDDINIIFDFNLNKTVSL